MFSLSNLPKWATVGLTFPLIFLNGWLLYQLCGILQPITNIVVAASLIAFLLDYPIRLLENRKMSRGLATALVLLIAVLLLTITLIFLGPLVWEQLNGLADRLPGWIEQGKNQLLLLDEKGIFQRLPIDLRDLTVQATNRISAALQSTTSQLINLTLTTIDSAVRSVATVVLSILLVFNGERLWNGILSWLPDAWQDRILTSLQPSFQGYFSGQATLALILATAQSIAFIFLNVPFGLLFGLGIGIASVIPFGGAVAILFVSVLLAFQSFWLGVKVLIVALLIGQINDNLIAPRLIGGVTGLNPAIVVISLLIGAKFAGFLGLILSVPTASFIKKIFDILKEPSVEAQSIGMVQEIVGSPSGPTT